MKPVTVVVMHHRPVGISQITDRVQLGDRAVHREHTISRNQEFVGRSRRALPEAWLQDRLYHCCGNDTVTLCRASTPSMMEA